MVNFKLGQEMKNDVINMSRVWDKEKNRKKSPTGIEPIIFRTPVGCSNH